MSTAANMAWLLIHATGLVMWLATIYMAVNLLEGVVM
jgi:hypothetical protein